MSAPEERSNGVQGMLLTHAVDQHNRLALLGDAFGSHGSCYLGGDSRGGVRKRGGGGQLWLDSAKPGKVPLSRSFR